MTYTGLGTAQPRHNRFLEQCDKGGCIMRRRLTILLHTCTALLCLTVLCACLGSHTAQHDEWPLAAGAAPLEEVLPNKDLRNAAMRVLAAREPWKLSGIDPAAGDDLIEGLPNELDEESVLERLVGSRPWTSALEIIEKGHDFSVTYELSNVVPAGYTRVEAYVSGIDEDGHTCRLEFEVIVRESDNVAVQAAMTSITSNF